jgi:hypothetical protein
MGVSTSAADYQPPGTSRAAQRAVMDIPTRDAMILAGVIGLGLLTLMIFVTRIAPHIG